MGLKLELFTSAGLLDIPPGGTPLTVVVVLALKSPAKKVACGINALAIADGGGMLVKGLASWNDVGVELLESGCTVKGAASEFCRIF